MRAYSAFMAGQQYEAACLVFARTAKEAKILAWDIQCGWWDAPEWTELRVRWIRDAGPEIWEQKQSDEPQVIESPISCEVCGQWGIVMHDDQICVDCAEAE